MLITGSVALNNALGVVRKPKDIDVIARPNEVDAVRDSLGPLEDTWYHPNGSIVFFPVDGPITEVEVAFAGSTGEWLLDREGDGFASKDALLALKLSHRYLRNSPHFIKTMEDIHRLRENGASVAGFEEWIKTRETQTYWYKHPNLKQNKEEFFGEDANRYAYDHDEIHECVALGSRPAYLEYLEPGYEVKCSKSLFFDAPEHVRLNGVAEEAMVLAYERSIVPFGTDPQYAVSVALMKVCTSITSGWFREFAWENFREVLEVLSKVDHGEIVKKLQGLTPVHDDVENKVRL